MLPHHSDEVLHKSLRRLHERVWAKYFNLSALLTTTLTGIRLMVCKCNDYTSTSKAANAVVI